VAAKPQSKPVHAGDAGPERPPRGADDSTRDAARPAGGADPAPQRFPPGPDAIAALERSVAALSRTAQALLEQQDRIAERDRQAAEPPSASARPDQRGREAQTALPRGAGDSVRGVDSTVPLASVSLKEAYPFPEPHFSADVVTSQVDKSRPVGSQKSAQLTYHESTGVLAVRGVRRDKSEWTCLIPASNIKGMRVLE